MCELRGFPFKALLAWNRNSISTALRWTFAGGIANTLLADALKPSCDVKGDNLSLVFPKSTSLDEIAGLIDGVDSESVHPIPNVEAMENLKFSECLSGELAAEVFTSRFDDRKAVGQALNERRRVMVAQ